MSEITHPNTDETPDYAEPTISDYGDLVELTAGTHTGSFLDATFPAHTPFSELTFSTTP
jgi:hypothetical protein